jgi:nitroreductase
MPTSLPRRRQARRAPLERSMARTLPELAADAPPGAAPAPMAGVAAAIALRQQCAPKRLLAPGPDSAQLDAYFRAAAAAPDHGTLTPWRFVVIPDAARARLAAAFAAALLQRDAQAAAVELEEARARAYRAPFLALAIARLQGDAGADIPAHERLVSLGAAIQNILLSAHADGFDSGLVSGASLRSEPLRRLFALDTGEVAVCFVAIGSARERRPMRPRPAPRVFVTELQVRAASGDETWI